MKAKAIIELVWAVMRVHEEHNHTSLVEQDFDGAMRRLVKAKAVLEEQEPK